MRYEIIERAGQWIVECDGLEIARHVQQDAALELVSKRLRTSGQERASLAVRFEKPAV